MQLKRLVIAQYKNYQDLNISFNKKFTGFIGLNGMGKTNLIDAIYYSSTGKSYFNVLDSQNILKGESYFTIEACFEKNEKNETVFCAYAKGQKKKIKLNQIVYEKLSDHYGKFPVVLVSPIDMALITEGNEERRKFIDSTLSVVNPSYLQQLIAYNKVLIQRNQILKNYLETRRLNTELLKTYNVQLEYHGSLLFKERTEFIKEFNVQFQKIISLINLNQEAVSLEYESELSHCSLGVLLEKNIEKEKLLGRTEFGCHKDKIVFNLENEPLKKFGSQGQQKTFIMSLKLAQAFFIEAKTGSKPILLLDDIFDRLDGERTKRLINLVGDSFNQIFLTDTSLERVKWGLSNFENDCSLFEIHEGNASLLN